MKEYLILVTILGLFGLGLMITLASGEGGLFTRRGRRAALDNLSGVLLQVVGYLVGLIAVHRFVGFPLELPW
jgi:hypothetical protein